MTLEETNEWRRISPPRSILFIIAVFIKYHEKDQWCKTNGMRRIIACRFRKLDKFFTTHPPNKLDTTT